MLSVPQPSEPKDFGSYTARVAISVAAATSLGEETMNIAAIINRFKASPCYNTNATCKFAVTLLRNVKNKSVKLIETPADLEGYRGVAVVSPNMEIQPPTACLVSDWVGLGSSQRAKIYAPQLEPYVLSVPRGKHITAWNLNIEGGNHSTLTVLGGIGLIDCVLDGCRADNAIFVSGAGGNATIVDCIVLNATNGITVCDRGSFNSYASKVRAVDNGVICHPAGMCEMYESTLSATATVGVKVAGRTGLDSVALSHSSANQGIAEASRPSNTEDDIAKKAVFKMANCRFENNLALNISLYGFCDVSVSGCSIEKRRKDRVEMAVDLSFSSNLEGHNSIYF